MEVLSHRSCRGALEQAHMEMSSCLHTVSPPSSLFPVL